MKTFIKNLALVIAAALLLVLISYSWAQEKEVKKLKSIRVYSFTPPSQETRYLQEVYYEGIKDAVFKFSQDGGKTWTMHDKNPVTQGGLDASASTGNVCVDGMAGLLMAWDRCAKFEEKYNTAHPLGEFDSHILGANEAQTRNVVSALQGYHHFIEGKSENNTSENRLNFLKSFQRSVRDAGEESFDRRLKEIVKKLESLGGDLSKLSEYEQSILTLELEVLERNYKRWLSIQKALEFYSKSLKPEEINENLVTLLELYEVPTIDLVRHALETKKQAEAAANPSQENCPDKK